MDGSLRPMLATAGELVPAIGEWSIEPKMDGWRAIVHRTADDQVRLYGGRNGSDYSSQLPEIEEQVRALVPLDTVLDGELTGQTGWGDVQSVMTRGATSPTLRLGIVLTAFDILRVAGEDARQLPQAMRRQLLESIQFDGRVRLIPSGPASQAKHEELVGLGAEGSVCKRADARYVAGRSPAWVKIKVKATAEAVVVGFKDAERGSRLDGLVGAFEVEMLDAQRAQTTVKCRTDEMHAEVTRNRGEWLGRIIEIEHNGLGATGKPRHPRFLRVRDDRVDTEAFSKSWASEAHRERNLAAASSFPATPSPGRKEVRRVGPTRRNYGAMGGAKLLKVIDELESGGDAAQRAIDKGFDPQEDLRIAREIAEGRGIA